MRELENLSYKYLPLTKQRSRFPGLGELAGGRFGVKNLGIPPHFEDAPSAGGQLHTLARRFPDFGRDTLGFREKVSLRTILDLYRHVPTMPQRLEGARETLREPHH